MKKVAVVLAGGKGERFGSDTPKQFIKLSGKLVIEHTVHLFERASGIDEIVIVCAEMYTDFVWELVSRNGWRKVQKVAVGGIDRFGSTDSALAVLSGYPSDTVVLLHDAVRPLLSETVIDACLAALESFEAVDVVIPSSDTLVVVHDNGCIANIPTRSTMRRGQTPQGFRLRTLSEAYQKAKARNVREFTCDCGVVRGTLPHIAVATVPGDETNIKITNPLDLFLAEKLMQSSGADAQHDVVGDLAGKNVVIFGGSSGIGQSIASVALARQANVWTASRSSNQVDVGDLASIRRFLDRVHLEAGSIDYVINTAGLLIRKPLDLMTEGEVSALINTNYYGSVNVAIAAKHYLAASRGMLVNFTSSSYTRGRSQYAIYSSTKCAVVNLTQALAEEWGVDNIRVNCVNPERTRTPMRTANFGVEPADSLLDPDVVAKRTLQVLTSNHTGMIIDVRQL